MGNLGCTSHGSTIVAPAPLFDPVATLQAVQEERCATTYRVPTMFARGAEAARTATAAFDLTLMRTGLMAGSPCR